MKPPVLVIDDEPDMLSSLRRLLRREFEVFTANGGAEGLALMAKEEVHVILTDQRMPSMTGVDFLDRVKTRYPDAIRMLFTGYADLDNVIRAVNDGQIYRYLVKPWNPEELLVIVREASERYDLIAARRQLTEELQRANAELEQRVQQRTAELAGANQRLEQLSQLKDEFLAIVSHDLRTPLAGILGAVDLLETEGFNDPANTSDLVKMIGRSGRRMLALVNNLLDLARIEAGRTMLDLRPMCLPVLLRECLEAMEPAAQVKEITCRLECAADLPDISGDSAKLYQVFNNLISNAIKFTPAGGGVTVRCVCDDEHTVRVSIEDTGRGISADELPRLFAKFEQTRTQATRGERGTGLGLYIVKKLVTLHGGTVSVTSALGVGSTFTVTLPAASDAPAVGECDRDPA